MFKKCVLRNVLCVFLLLTLGACGSSEESINEYMEQGSELFQNERYEKAILAYKNVLQIDPKHVAAHYQIAETLSKLGKVRKAYGHYMSAISLDELHLMSRIRVGQLMLLSGQREKAEEYLQEVVKLAPDDAEVLVFQSAMDILNNDADSALVNLDKTLSINPEAASAIVMKASIFAKKGEVDAAIKLLQKATTDLPGHESMHLLLANLYIQSDLKQNAEKEFNLLIKLKPDSIKYYKSLALFFIKDEKLSDAEKVLRRAVDQLSEKETAQLYLLDFLSKKRSLDVAIDEAKSLSSRFPEVFQYSYKLFSLLLEKGEVEEAETTIKKVISEEKVGAAIIQAKNALSRLYVATKRMDESRLLVAEILSENPKDVEALTLRAQFSLADKKYPDAIIDLRSILLALPKNVKALKMLSKAQLANKDFSLARENLEKLLAITPNDIESRQELIDLLLHSGHKIQARSQVDLILNQDPDNNKALASLFRLKVSEKDWEQAQKISTQLEDKAMGHYLSGLAFQAEKKLEKSNAAFKRALMINPDSVQPLFFLVKNYSELNLLAEGIEFFKTLSQKFPKNVVVLDQLGQFYAKNKNTAKAEKIFTETIVLQPEWSQGYKNLAKILKIKQDALAAKAVLSEGLEKTNGSLDLLNDLVVMYHNEGKFKKIIALYQQAYQKNPNSLIVMNNLAGYLSDYGEQDEKNMTIAAKIAEPLNKSENPNFLDTVAWIAYKQKKYDKAQQILEQAMALGGDHLILSYHLGMVYYHQGNLDLAQNFLKKAVTAESEFPGLSEARNILAQLKASDS